IPYFDTSSRDRSQSRRLWMGRSEPALLAGCDPKMFASDVFQYLSRARTIKAEIDGRRLRERPPEEDRRRAPRWLPIEVPWVSSVRLAAAERAELLDISSNGALLRSYDRPRLVTRKSEALDLGPRPELTLQLIPGEESRVAGRIVPVRRVAGPLSSRAVPQRSRKHRLRHARHRRFCPPRAFSRHRPVGSVVSPDLIRRTRILLHGS